MLLSGTFAQLQQVARAEERTESHAETSERVGTAFLAVDDADGVPDDETLVTDGRHRLRERSAGGDDVLEEAHQLTRCENPLDAFGRAVFLGFTAHDDEGQTGRHCCRSCQRHRPESGAGKPNSVRLGVAYGARECLAERTENLGLGLEPVLVEVPGRRAPGAKDEIALEQRPLDEQPAELVVRHVRSAERVIEASRSNPGVPGSSTTADPSAYETPARSSEPDGPKSLRQAQTARTTRMTSRMSFLTPTPPWACASNAASSATCRSPARTCAGRRPRAPRSASGRSSRRRCGRLRVRRRTRLPR